MRTPRISRSDMIYNSWTCSRSVEGCSDKSMQRHNLGGNTNPPPDFSPQPCSDCGEVDDVVYGRCAKCQLFRSTMIVMYNHYRIDEDVRICVCKGEFDKLANRHKKPIHKHLHQFLSVCRMDMSFMEAVHAVEAEIEKLTEEEAKDILRPHSWSMRIMESRRTA